MRSMHFPSTYLLICVEAQTNLVAINQLGRIVARWAGSSEIIHLNLNHFSEEVVVGMIDEFNNAFIVALRY